MKKYFLLLPCIAIAVTKSLNKDTKSSEDGSLLHPVVRTRCGPVKGKTQMTYDGHLIYSFLGMRYAEPPIGNLRFKSPMPVKKWTTIYDATKDGAVCPQPTIFKTSEDCLFINVHTPQLPRQQKSNPKYPVIVYIHPGGLNTMSGSNSFFGPHYLLSMNVVLVTFNYRLGALGFLSTGDEHAQGNYGLKDQVEALRWVKENIGDFGGNPNSVTLAGCSAGGASASAHLVSPMSQGLFHRALLMSGSTFGNFLPKTSQLDLVEKLAQIVGCPIHNRNDMMNCLRNVSAEELGNAYGSFKIIGEVPTVLWQFVIEPDFGQERFLIENPLISLQKGHFADVPIIMGITYDEGLSFAYPFIIKEGGIEQFNSNIDNILPYMLYYDPHSSTTDYITKELKRFYLDNKPVTKNSLESLGELFSDTLVSFGMNRGARFLSKYNRNNLYYYVFRYKGRHSYLLPIRNYTKKYVVHSDDQIYLFWNSLGFPMFTSTDPEIDIVKIMTKFYANFAEHGNPTPSQGGDDIKWLPFNSEEKMYLEIDNELKMKSNLFPKRYQECESLFPLPELKKH